MKTRYVGHTKNYVRPEIRQMLAPVRFTVARDIIQQEESGVMSRRCGRGSAS